MSILIIIIAYIVAGFIFGKITCSAHSRVPGLFLTILVLIVLNFTHSLVDGIGFASVMGTSKVWILIIHEIVRQGLLYFFLWKILQEFISQPSRKAILLFISITVVWILAALLGNWLAVHLQSLQSFDELLTMSIFFFIGDFAHHGVEGFHALKNSHHGKTHSH